MIDRHEERWAPAGRELESDPVSAHGDGSRLPDVEGYEVLRRLDAGGQGSVFLAYQNNTGRRVAIKLLRDIGGDQAMRRERLRREASFLSRLHHPNIVTIHDIGECDGQLFLVTDFIDGVPIDDFVNLQGASVREIVELIVKVCDAIAVAHTAGVIHRDLKPQNIVVDQNSQPYVVDFGLAQSVDDVLPRISEADAVVGTVEYLPPERIAGHHPDTRSDVYALGMVLYECIADRLPFAGNNRAAMLHAIVYDDPLPLRKASAGDKLNPHTTPAHISKDLEAVVLTAMTRDLKSRYQSAADFAEDLRRYLANEPVLARTTSTGYMLRRLLRRYRVHVSAAAMLLVMLVVSLVVTISAWRTTAEKASQFQAAYNMAAAQNISDFERGKSQAQTAIENLDAALRVADQLEQTSPIVELQLYNTHYRLADLYLAEGQLGEARAHAEAAFNLAPRLLASGIGNTQSASSLYLRGKIALKERRFEDAVASLLPAINEFERIAHDPPDAYPYEFQIANVSIRAATALVKAGRPEEAYSHYARALELRQALVERSPDNVDFAMRLADAELHLAVWHVNRGTADDAKLALAHCANGLARLDAIAPARLTDYGKGIRTTLREVRRRARATVTSHGPPT